MAIYIELLRSSEWCIVLFCFPQIASVAIYIKLLRSSCAEAAS